MVNYNSNIDVTVATKVLLTDGIGRQGIGLVNCIQDSLKVNALQLPPSNYKDVPQNAMKVFAKPFDGFGKVTFWTYILGLNEDMIQTHQAITSPLKIAYSMFESDRIPNLWTKILNQFYDMVVVPDFYLIDVYKNSGVKIPIFVLPLGIMIEDFLNQPLKEKANEVFTFGMTAGFWQRKNHIKLLYAFKEAFGNNLDFKLKLHGRFGSYQREVERAVEEANLSNVELTSKPFTPKEYLEFMKSLDCYVYPSMGEGFSITPREALALGIPCILSNNSVHRTISCLNNNLFNVSKLSSNEKVPAIYEVFDNQRIGHFYDCKIEELIHLMKEMVNGYEDWLERTSRARKWVKQYLWSELKPTYLNLFQPKKIILKEKEEINFLDSEVIQTCDKKLYRKLNELQ